jgi:hypothetical protein
LLALHVGTGQVGPRQNNRFLIAAILQQYRGALKSFNSLIVLVLLAVNNCDVIQCRCFTLVLPTARHKASERL